MSRMPFDQLFQPAGSGGRTCRLNVVVLVSVYVGAGVLVGEGAVTVKVATIVPGFMPTCAAVRATVGVVAVITVTPSVRVMLQLYVVIGQLCAGGIVFRPGADGVPSKVIA